MEDPMEGGSDGDHDDADAVHAHQPSGEVEHAAAEAAAAQQAGGVARTAAAGLVRVPTARKDEVQRVLGQSLVLKCDPAGPYSAPVVIMSSEESNIYTLVEKHFREDYLMGPEKFWRLVRADMQVDTWRPRVQGTQLKALAGARLPESEEEFASISQVIQSLQDCLKPESSPELFMQELRITIGQIQAWWENRNRRQDGGVKRGAPTGMAAPGSKKRLGNAVMAAGLQLLGASGEQLLGTAMLGGSSYLPMAAAVNGYMQHDQSGYMDADTDAAAAAAAAAAAGGLGDGVQFQPGSSHQPLPNGQAVLGNPLTSLYSSTNPSAPLLLDVGGKKFRTTLTTLLAVHGSLFWLLVQGQGQAGVLQQLAPGELFIDRSGAVFEYVLEYLRACACNEPTFPLPNDARELQALAREAAFYQLPGLLDHINATSIMPQPATRIYYDSIYLETGYKSIEGAGLKEMEQCKVLIMQQMNHVLSLRAQQGFYVDDMVCGVAHRDTDEPGSGGTQHNLYYNILLKKVVPLLPEGLLGGQEEEEGDEGEGDEEDQLLGPGQE